MAVVKNLMVRAGADFSSMKRSMDKASKDIAGFKNSLEGALKGLKTALATIGIGKVIKDAVNSAMQVEAAMGQINRMMGSSAKEFTDWASKSAAAFGLSKAEAIRYGATYANLISNFSGSTAKTEQLTTDLLKTSTVVASATGRTMEDVMERIRSGMLGETDAIEDLGININQSMLKSTDAFKRFAGDKSWDQLSFQTQQQIIYFAIMEQASKKYGTSLADNTSSSQAQFVAQLKNAQLNLGQAFLPIYQAILPALTAMASALASVTSILAQFSQALFGKKAAAQTVQTQKQAAAVTGLGDAYKSAGKAASNAVASFDEVNQLADKSGTDATDAAATGQPVSSNDANQTASATEEISGKVQEMADKVKAIFADLAKTIQENKDIIIAALAGIAAAFTLYFIATNWPVIIAAIRAAITALSESCVAAWAAITAPIALIAIAVGVLVAAFVYFYKTNESFRGVVDGILKAIGDAALWVWNNVLVPMGQFLSGVFIAAWKAVGVVATWLWQNVLVPLGSYLMDFYTYVLVPLGTILSEALTIAFEGLADIAKSFWKNVMVPLGEFLADTFGPTVEALQAVFTALWHYALEPLAIIIGETLLFAVGGLTEAFKFLWNYVLEPLTKFIVGVFVTAFDTAFQMIHAAIDGLKTTFNGLMEFITGVFTGDWKKAWQGVSDIFSGIFGGLYDIVKVPLNLIIDGINSVIGGLNSLSFTIPDWVPDYGGKTWGINITKLPKLARGGIVDGATNMGNYIAGEAGAEMVVPLENTSFVNAMASALGTAVMNAMQFGGKNQSSTGGSAAMQLDGTTFARLIAPYLQRELSRVGTAMIPASGSAVTITAT